MKKSFRYRFDRKTFIALIVLTTICLFVFALNLGNLLGLKIYPYESISKVLFPTILSAVVATFLVLIILLSKYDVESDFFKIRIMGIFVVKAIAYENISTIKLHRKEDMLILFFLDKEIKQYKMIPINITEKEEFVKAMRTKNPTIYYEEID